MEQNIVTAPTLHNEKLVSIDDNDLAHPISTQQYITAATSENQNSIIATDQIYMEFKKHR
jgi:hypothetical protein